MSTRTTTNAAERIDLLMHQAEQFLGLDLVGEAIARARHALSQCAKEMRDATDDATRRDIQTRRGYIESFLVRLGAKPVPSESQHATI